MKQNNFFILLLIVGFTTIMTAQVPSYVPTNGLVGYWPFNGNANDVSTNANNGTNNGATLTTDRFGNVNSSYSFNGLSNYIQIPNSNSLQNINEISISAWINISQLYQSAGAGHFPIICKSNLQFGGNLDFLISNQNILAHLNTYNTIASFPLSFNTWQNVVATISNGITSFYLNGNLLWSGVSGTFNNQPNNLPLVIGMDSPGLVEYSNGKIDDIGIWNRALTQTEINNLYNANICYQNVTVTDILVINVGILGYNPVTYTNSITIYPNPANDHITLDCGTLSSVTGYQIKISNLLGQEVFSTTLNQQQYSIPLNSWTGRGIYLVKVYDANNNLLTSRKIDLQ